LVVWLWEGVAFTFLAPWGWPVKVLMFGVCELELHLFGLLIDFGYSILSLFRFLGPPPSLVCTLRSVLNGFQVSYCKSIVVVSFQ